MAAALTLACGKKGPPLAPLNLVPDRPLETAGRVSGATVYLSMTVPTKNANGRGALTLDHLEIYAVTVDAGAIAPPNRELLLGAHSIAKIPIKPPVDPDAEDQEQSPDDTRPKAGDRVVFAEALTEAQTTPQVKATPANAKQAAAASTGESAETPVAGAPSTPTVPLLTSPESVPATGSGAAVVGVPTGLPGTPATEEPTTAEETGAPTGVAAETPQAATAAPGSAATAAQAAAAAAKPSPMVTRVYVIRGMTKKGRPGTPSTRIVVPIVPPPPPPTGVTADYSETSVTISWKAPEDTGAATHAPFTFNVYPQVPAAAPPSTAASTGVVSAPAPLNAQPVDTLTLEHAGAAPGKEQCFVVRTVETIALIPVESDSSAPVCVTPVDKFAPAAPTGLAVVGTAGAMNLIWDANTEADVAGYVVLRGESPGGTLQPLTPEPIRETRFRDTTAQPGVRYAYAIVAVDRAGNRSAPSARVEETAR